MDIAGATAAGLERARGTRIQTGQRGRASGVARIGSPGVFQVDDIAGTTASCVDCWTGRARDGGMRFDDVVICGCWHYERCILLLH